MRENIYLILVLYVQTGSVHYLPNLNEEKGDAYDSQYNIMDTQQIDHRIEDLTKASLRKDLERELSDLGRPGMDSQDMQGLGMNDVIMNPGLLKYTMGDPGMTGLEIVDSELGQAMKEYAMGDTELEGPDLAILTLSGRRKGLEIHEYGQNKSDLTMDGPIVSGRRTDSAMGGSGMVPRIQDYGLGDSERGPRIQDYDQATRSSSKDDPPIPPGIQDYGIGDLGMDSLIGRKDMGGKNLDLLGGLGVEEPGIGEPNIGGINMNKITEMHGPQISEVGVPRMGQDEMARIGIGRPNMGIGMQDYSLGPSYMEGLGIEGTGMGVPGIGQGLYDNKVEGPIMKEPTMAENLKRYPALQFPEMEDPNTLFKSYDVPNFADLSPKPRNTKANLGRAPSPTKKHKTTEESFTFKKLDLNFFLGQSTNSLGLSYMSNLPQIPLDPFYTNIPHKQQTRSGFGKQSPPKYQSQQNQRLDLKYPILPVREMNRVAILGKQGPQELSALKTISVQRPKQKRLKASVTAQNYSKSRIDTKSYTRRFKPYAKQKSYTELVKTKTTKQHILESTKTKTVINNEDQKTKENIIIDMNTPSKFKTNTAWRKQLGVHLNNTLPNLSQPTNSNDLFNPRDIQQDDTKTLTSSANELEARDDFIDLPNIGATASVKTIENSIDQILTTTMSMTTDARYDETEDLINFKVAKTSKPFESLFALKMIELKAGPFITFACLVTEAMTKKNERDLQKLIRAFVEEHAKIRNRNTDFSDVGEPFCTALQDLSTFMSSSLSNARHYFELILQGLNKRKYVLSKNLNNLLEQVDSIFDLNERTDIEAITLAFIDYPSQQNYQDANDILRNMFEKMMINPILRLMGLSQRKTVLETLNLYLHNYIYPNVEIKIPKRDRAFGNFLISERRANYHNASVIWHRENNIFKRSASQSEINKQGMLDTEAIHFAQQPKVKTNIMVGDDIEEKIYNNAEYSNSNEDKFSHHNFSRNISIAGQRLPLKISKTPNITTTAKFITSKINGNLHISFITKDLKSNGNVNNTKSNTNENYTTVTGRRNNEDVDGFVEYVEHHERFNNTLNNTIILKIYEIKTKSFDVTEHTLPEKFNKDENKSWYTKMK